jgi:hypothetical protein
LLDISDENEEGYKGEPQKYRTMKRKETMKTLLTSVMKMKKGELQKYRKRSRQKTMMTKRLPRSGRW